MARPVYHKRGSSYELALPRVHRPDVQRMNPQVTAGEGGTGPTPHGGILAVYGGEEVKGLAETFSCYSFTNALRLRSVSFRVPIPAPAKRRALSRNSRS